jgi:hypothetical protein
MRLYPSPARRRRATIARDAAVVLLLLTFGWLGLKVHDAVADLAVLGRGVRDAGSAVEGTSRSVGGALRDGFDAAGDAVGGAPLVGGELAGALRSAGDRAASGVGEAGSASGGELAAAGREGEERVLALARLLGWLTFVLPSALLLASWLPWRVAQVRRLGEAARVLEAGDPADPERRRLVAMRAAFGLPYATLLRHTSDPFGDLGAGRHDALLAAVREDAGLSAAISRAPGAPGGGAGSGAA